MQEFCHFNRERLSSNVAKVISSGNNGMQIRRLSQCRGILEHFDKGFNNVTKTDKKFSPVGWITDMVTANFNGPQLIYGDDVLHKIKGCEFHFCQSINPHASKCSNQEWFKVRQ